MIFPYLSVYILVFSFISFILFILSPCPHGKWALDLTLMIDPDIAWMMMQIPTLIVIFGYFDFDNNKWVSDLPSTNKGSIALIFFTIHFIWRGILSVIWIKKIHQDLPETRGSKKTSFIVVLVSWFYYPVVGMLIRYMCVNIDDTISAHDLIFLVGCFVFLGLNGYVDIVLNKNRCISPDVKTYPSIGIYLTKDGLKKHFKMLIHLGIDCPNYFFEMLEWGFFALFTMRFESLWWFLSTLLILLPRALWSSHWYCEEVEIHQELLEQPVEKVEIVKPVKVVKPIKMKNIHKSVKLNGLVF